MIRKQLKKGTPVILTFSGGRKMRGHITSDLMIGDYYAVLCENRHRALALPEELTEAGEEGGDSRDSVT